MSGLLDVQVIFVIISRHGRIHEGLRSGVLRNWTAVIRCLQTLVAVSHAPQVPVYEVIDSSGLNVRSQRTPSSSPSKAMLDIQPKTSVSRPPAHTYSPIRRKSFKSPMAIDLA
ncbi:hypothetical protein CY34DRAFT_801447 [Suillus luteus UH-Slu-Lm8-n1]|uniref:Uncharacterized protein n=1 Tax=Suillus luteus UH-Slu-Lm8-n1 TaxID=930992 RepID=A0A0D0BR78_9AGAM|nr:hypothetical protein CY34DRAFT_801447 [Suillus luteus UH-Slu-Lm8-n1]